MCNEKDSRIFDEVGPDWYQQNGAYFRHLALAHKPNKYPICWVYSLEHFPGVRSVSIHVKQVDNSKSVHQANRFSLRKKLQNATWNISILRHAKNKMLQALGKEGAETISDESSFNLSVYFQLCAGSKEDLDFCTGLIIEAAEDFGISLEPIQMSHTEAMQSCAPIGLDQLDMSFRMDAEAAAATSFVFFDSPDSNSDSD